MTVFQDEFTVTPVQNGGFLMRTERRYAPGELRPIGSESTMYAFTSLADLMSFLGKHASPAGACRSVPPFVPPLLDAEQFRPAAAV